MKVVAVFSTKGGVGKTTAAVNLAWEASREFRVLLWDLDPQSASTYLLNVKPKLKGGADALVSGKSTAAKSIRSTDYDRLDVLPADETYRDLDLALDAAKKSTERIARVLDTVKNAYDIVILDCPPGSSLVAENALRAADVVVVPLVPSPLSLRSLDQVAAIVAESRQPAPVLAFLSMVDRRKTAHRAAVENMPGEGGNASAVVIDIVVASTVILERMGAERAPVAAFAPRSEASLAYRQIWERVRSLATPKRAKAGR